MTDKRSAPVERPLQSAVDRRNFLKTLGAGAGATSLAVAGAVVAPAEAAAAESAADKKKKRYQETDHVRAYYRTNRY